MEYENHLASNIHNQKKTHAWSRHERWCFLFWSALSIWLGLRTLIWLKGVLANVWAHRVQQGWGAFSSVSCIVNRTTAKSGVPAKQELHYVITWESRREDPGLTCSFGNDKEKTKPFFSSLEIWVSRACKASRHKGNWLCLGQFLAHGFA